MQSIAKCYVRRYSALVALARGRTPTIDVPDGDPYVLEALLGRRARDGQLFVLEPFLLDAYGVIPLKM